MNISKKNILILSGVLVGLLLIWLGLSFYSVGRVANELNLLVSQPDPKSSLRFKNLQHQTGFLSSKGDVLVSLVDKYNDENNTDANAVWMQIKYDVSHVILPTSLARFEWRLQPQPEDKAKFEEIFPKDFALTGHGSVSPTGSYSSTLFLPAFEISQSGELLNVAATQGYIKMSDKHFQFDWATDKLNYRGAGQAVQIDVFNIHIDMSDTLKGIGSSSVSMQKISTSSATLEGLKIAADSAVAQNKLDVRLTQSLQRVSFMNQTLSNLEAEWVVGGLHDQSAEKLIQLMDLSQGFKNMTAEEDKSMREAVKVLLINGWKVGLSKLNAQADGGAVQGQLLLELQADAGGQIDLEKNLKLNGEIKVSGQLLTPDQQNMLMKLGMAVKTAEGLQANVSMTQGKLKFNGKENEAVNLQAELRKEQSRLEAFLSGSPQHSQNSSTSMPEIEDEVVSNQAPTPAAPAEPTEKAAE
jgi:hypothetical protein